MAKLFNYKLMGDALLLIPAFFMALLPNSLEETFNIKLFGYDFFVFLFLGVGALLFRKRDKNKSKSRGNYLLLLLSIIAFFSGLINSDDYFFAHFAIGVEFILGYLFAERISYDELFLKYIKILSFVLLALVLIQQISFAFGLDYFTTGQENQMEMAGGILRAGTTVGGATYTGIFVPLLIGIIISLTNNPYIKIAVLLIGFFSVVISGTRSAMLLMGLVGVFLFFQSNAKIHPIIKIIAVVAFFVYIFPIMHGIVEERNFETREDLTSGRVERWQYLIKSMNEEPLSYLCGNGGGTVPISDYNKQIKILASPHNVYLGFLFEFGAIALLLFICFIIKKIRDLNSYFTSGVLILLASLLICWNSEVVPLAFQYSFFFWLLYFVEYTQQNKSRSLNH